MKLRRRSVVRNFVCAQIFWKVVSYVWIVSVKNIPIFDDRLLIKLGASSGRSKMNKTDSIDSMRTFIRLLIRNTLFTG